LKTLTFCHPFPFNGPFLLYPLMLSWPVVLFQLLAPSAGGPRSVSSSTPPPPNQVYLLINFGTLSLVPFSLAFLPKTRTLFSFLLMVVRTQSPIIPPFIFEVPMTSFEPCLFSHPPRFCLSPPVAPSQWHRMFPHPSTAQKERSHHHFPPRLSVVPFPTLFPQPLWFGFALPSKSYSGPEVHKARVIPKVFFALSRPPPCFQQFFAVVVTFPHLPPRSIPPWCHILRIPGLDPNIFYGSPRHLLSHSALSPLLV